MNKQEIKKGYSDNNLVFNDNVEMDLKESEELFIVLKETVSNVNINVCANVKLYINYDVEVENINYAINIEKGASLEIVFMQNFNHTQHNIKAEISDNATLNLFIVDLSVISQNNLVINLNGEYATCNLYNATVSQKQANNEFHIKANHNYKVTESNCTSRAVIFDESKYFNKTEGFISKGMSQSKCHQDTKAIVFDSRASAQCDPVLLIDEYDVEASHAAAVGQVNADDLYYLQSRGLSYDQCIALLVSGFITSIINNVYNEEVKEMIIDDIQKRLTV